MTISSLIDGFRTFLRNSRLVTAHTSTTRPPKLTVAERTTRMKAVLTTQDERANSERAVVEHIYGRSANAK